MLKPYFVELKISAVVMAESNIDAMAVAENGQFDISYDCEFTADEAIEIKSIEHLKRLDGLWDGMCLPYNGDGNTRLKDLLPESDPFKDTNTQDMFEACRA
ncbi:hypothetical protein [Quatrionicoccus australiensis]|uniref:hypothetical protein n=1 Tax=Quatrionicoccus australiensis TaxID=138118 RepID=UPI001CF9867D|nr:hypothetical protein [Quatrionicoccus australiensis]MCB4358472.1 hypothetical protein [Quatrionicoccus australiensis]